MTEVHIGFVGLGAMGMGMARNLAAKGNALLFVYDVDVRRLESAAAWGAKICGSPAEVAARSQVVFTMLPDDRVAAQVARGPGGLLEGAHQGLVFADFSTIGPWTLRSLAEDLAPAGVHTVGGAATLGTKAAEAGELAVFLDEIEESTAQILPLVQRFATTVMPTGGLGSAKTMKLLNNLMVGVNVAATAEALVLGLKAGIPVETLIPILLKGSGSSYALRHHFADALLKNALGPGRFPVSYILKDLYLAQQLAQQSRHSMAFGSLAASAYRGAEALGFADHYYPIVVRWMEHICGLDAGQSQGSSRAA
jgi:3-hydroxyisobutyrate dehydrogenase-like beta-hydroxyacid dehydrogenase